ncbi:solute carrier family 22 member 22-like [Cydia fagiglandana]|uniref:solute carrier family 22 member 22-like n=1 Tax=Cydia fagiglandana TaxID=1458189 RepID=UPI002FEE0296
MGCVIPECENTSTATFAPPWILDAVPSSGDILDNCHRYATTSIAGNTSDCSAELFDTNSTLQCEEYVYEHKTSAFYEFNLACDDFLPTLVGSVNTLGMMVCLPITGLISDRYGRRLALALTNFNLAWIGSLTYFAGSYASYISLSFLTNLFGSCYFSCAYILGKL